MYVAIEGPNQSGKTTLIGAILPMFNNYTFIKLPYNVDFQLATKDTELFERICFEQILNLPKEGNLLTDRSYVSYVVYNVARRVYRKELKVHDITNELTTMLRKVTPLIRPIDWLILLEVMPKDFERWIQLHNQRFYFLAEPHIFSQAVHLTWFLFKRVAMKEGMRVLALAAYQPLHIQANLIRLMKELIEP